MSIFWSEYGRYLQSYQYATYCNKKKQKKLSLKQKVFHLFKKPWQNIEDITLCSGVYTLLLQKMFYWMSPASDSK